MAGARGGGGNTSINEVDHQLEGPPYRDSGTQNYLNVVNKHQRNQSANVHSFGVQNVPSSSECIIGKYESCDDVLERFDSQIGTFVPSIKDFQNISNSDVTEAINNFENKRENS